MQAQTPVRGDQTMRLASSLSRPTHTNVAVSFPALPPIGSFDHLMNSRKFYWNVINDDANKELRDQRNTQVMDSDESYRSIKSNLDTLYDAGLKTNLVSCRQSAHKPANDLNSPMANQLDRWRTSNNRLPAKSGPLGPLTYDDVQRETDQGKFTPSTVCRPSQRTAHSTVAAKSELDGNCACFPLHLNPTGREQQPRLLGKTSHRRIAHTTTVSTQPNYGSTDSTNLRVDEADIPALWIVPPETRRHRRGSLSSAGITTGPYRSRGPGVLSPAVLAPLVDDVCHASWNMSISPIHTPQSSFSPIPYQCQLAKRQPLSSLQMSPKLSEPGILCIQGFYICRCCPKKPNKFQTARELRAHMAQKRYKCSHCGNRFKNKSEAARHEMSLHVQRRSWSCSSLYLAGYDKAFHQSTTYPDDSDVCGYCGEEFFRSGNTSHPRLPTERDWSDRLRHLHDVHRFIECNASKRYFRADHFRQHLKHSHAATNGEWSSMLITACIMDIGLPLPSKPKRSS